MSIRKEIYMIMALLTLCIAGARAQEIEIPEDAPRETWQLVYDDYRSLGYRWNAMYGDPQYKDITMDVTVVRGENCLYVQGIAKNCHDSWIKIEISEDMTDDRLLMLSNQPVTASGETQYINTGVFNCEWDSGTRHVGFEIIAQGSDTPLSLYRDLSYEGIKYAAKEKTGYWLAVVPNHRFDECVVRWTSPYSPRKENGGIPEEELFKEKECYLNPCLIAKASGIGNVNAIGDETNPPVYTLTGVKVNPDRLTPGIYIRAGRKFIVR